MTAILATAFAFVPAGLRAQTDVATQVAQTLEAWRTGDFAAFGASYHPDARGFFLDGGALIRGVNVPALQAAYDAGLRADLTLRDLDVARDGDVAVSAGYLDGALTLPGGQRVEGTWRYTETRRLRGDRWLIVQYHFSRQEPLAARGRNGASRVTRATGVGFEAALPGG